MPTNQRIWAYAWIFYIVCTLLGAHYFVYRFSFHPLNPYQVTRALVFASIIWCTVLMIGMIFRYAWTRYVLVAWLIITIVGFLAAMLQMNSQSIASLPMPTHDVIKGVFLYALAIAPLIFSRALGRFLAPRTAGGL